MTDLANGSRLTPKHLVQDPASARRTSEFFLPLLVTRCKMVLIEMLEDLPLRGAMPFERAREEELIYVLQRLLDLEVWEDGLRAVAQGESTYFPLLLAPRLTFVSSQGTLGLQLSSRHYWHPLEPIFSIYIQSCSISRRTVARVTCPRSGLPHGMAHQVMTGNFTSPRTSRMRKKVRQRLQTRKAKRRTMLWKWMPGL